MSHEEPLLAEREKSHGDFRLQFNFAQELKMQLRKAPGYEFTGTTQREALDMICTKISRVLYGDASHKDHWDDIAGYAQLGSKACDL